MLSKYLLVTLFASFFIGDTKWTDPEPLMRLQATVYDACVDSNNNILVLFQDIDSEDLEALTYVNSGSYIDSIRHVMRNKGIKHYYPRNTILCRQNANNDVMAFSVTEYSDNGAGIFAEARGIGSFFEKYKKEGIKGGGSLLFINSTERTVLFLANETSLWFVTRPAGSEIFSNEQVIYTADYSTPISDVTSAASKRRGDFVWHVATRIREKVYYFFGENNGAKWDKPYILENVKVRSCSLSAISLIANYDLTTTIFLAYTDNTYYNLHLTWSIDKGETWAQPIDTSMDAAYSHPNGFLYTINGNPALFLLSFRGNYTISKSWTEKKIEFSRGEVPLWKPACTPQPSQPSLLQAFGNYRDIKYWLSSSNQTSLEKMKA